MKEKIQSPSCPYRVRAVAVRAPASSPLFLLLYVVVVVVVVVVSLPPRIEPQFNVEIFHPSLIKKTARTGKDKFVSTSVAFSSLYRAASVQEHVCSFVLLFPSVNRDNEESAVFRVPTSSGSLLTSSSTRTH